MRRVSIATLVCALIFGILSTWLAPKMITYWYAPPVPAGASVAFNCTDAVAWAMRKLVWTQLIGSLGGAAIGVVIGILLVRRKPAEARPPAAGPGETERTRPPRREQNRGPTRGPTCA